MAKAYSLDLRQKVVNLISEGKSKIFISKLLKIDTKTIYNWLKRYKEQNTLESNTKNNKRPNTIDIEKLEKYIISNPSKTLKQVGKVFSVSDVGVLKVLRKLDYSFKKRDFSTLKEMKKKESCLWRK